MSSIKKYYEDVYLKEYTSKITAIGKYGNLENTYYIELSETIFFPEGGGQSCDLGTISGFPVKEVKEKDHHIYHILNLEHEIDNYSELSIGSEVSLVLDWDRRFDNMQRHCGEHILSGIFYSEYGGINRGFHMGDDYMTIDISLEERPEFKELTYDMAKHVELLANQVIWSNAPVTRRVYSSRSETAGLPLRKALAIDEDISVVCVGSEENASDCVACCGTHPSSAGQVGLIKIYKVESNKGMFRVYCEAGNRAFRDYVAKHDIITTLSGKYSATSETLLDQIKREDEKNKAVRHELHVLKQSVIRQRGLEISADIESILRENAAEARKKINIYEFDDLKPDDVLAIGRVISVAPPKLLALISAPDNTVFLISDGKTCDCGKLVKDNASIYNGKGGGRADNARALFPNREYLDIFLDLIEKHLR